ncbi:MAG: hypothetical protein A2Z25_12660 [Planctomycetes bacterium RBG_16_55_9]|nr:MAG: hypothetical protein A2Z25_12660 [Planctomycetes bacterium RBG_16_55_9]
MSDIKPQLSLPAGCPFCGGAIEVTQIKCTGCASEIKGSFKTEGMSTLPAEYQKFIAVFLRHRGNIKAVEKELGISYPTINKMLDSINTMLDATATTHEKPLTRKEILDSIERGEMSVKDATFILKTRDK